MTVSPTARLPRQPPASAQVRAPHSMDYNPDTMALITSDRDAMRSPARQMALITSDCAPFRAWQSCSRTTTQGGSPS